MTFRSPPRTTTGLTGLGAVGGPTGVGAGALRVIVEFLTQYDAEKVKQLEADLKRIENLQQLSDARASKANKSRAADEAALRKIQDLRLSLSSQEAKEIRKIRDAERTRGNAAKANAVALTRALATTSGLREQDIKLLVDQDKIEARIARRAEARRVTQRKEQARAQALQRAQVTTERQLFSLQTLRAQLVPKLGSLALGAAGGILGGAVLGVGFAAAQAGLEAVGQLLRDILDPANRARDALEGVTKEVRSLADKEGLTLLEASTRVLEQYGDAAKAISPELLAAAAATQSMVEENEELSKIMEVVRHQQQLENEELRQRIQLLAQQQGIGLNRPDIRARINQAIETRDPSALTPQELQLYTAALNQLEAASTSASLASYRLAQAERVAAGAAQIASFAQDQLADSLRQLSGLRITGLEDQLQALNDAGPSQRTQELTRRIEGLAEAQARSSYQSQIQSLQEERALLLLEQRIRFQGESIRLDQVAGRAALVVIDQRIRALQNAGAAEQAQLDALGDRIAALRRADQEQDKRDQEALERFDERIEKIREAGDAQERLNRLLDLQYRLGQTIRRQEGESIGDFIQRRANETRQLLAEQDALQRESQIADIEKRRDAVAAIQEERNERREAAIEALELQQQQLQARIEAINRARQAEIAALQERRDEIALEVQLTENAEQQKQAAEQETARLQAKRLQEQLRRSEERDRRETESRRKAIEDQIKAERERLDLVLKWADIEQAERLRVAAFGARSYADAQTLIGELAGSRRALAELEAYAKANQISPEIAELILGPLRQSVREAQARVDSILRQTFGNIPQGPGFAKGGVIELSNSRSPFGSNLRFGEEGQEIGVILSNKVARILQETTRPSVGDQTFVINRSDDPYRDRDRFGRAVRDAVSEALG